MSGDVEDVNGDLLLVDRDHNTDGQKGYKIIREDFDWQNIPASYSDSIWEIRYAFDLATESIVLPENVTLKFSGGVLKNAALITGNNTDVKAECDMGILINNSYAGTWCIDEIFAEWFGAIGDDSNDDKNPLEEALNFAADYGACLRLLAKKYRINSQIVIQKSQFKNSALQIKGYPYRSIIKPYLSGGYALVFDGDTRELPVLIDGLAMDGSESTSGTSGMLLNRNQSSNISNLFIHKFKGIGFRMSENWNVLITNIEVRNCEGSGIHLESVPSQYHATTQEINNITFVGGTSSGNGTGVQIASDGSATKCENLAFYGMNTSNETKGWQVFNTDESVFDTIYLEQKLTAENQMYFKDCNSCEIRSPHVTANKNIFKIEDCNQFIISTLRQQSSINSSDTIVDVKDSYIKLMNWNVTGGGNGTFCKYVQSPSKLVNITFDNVRAVSFNDLFDETIDVGFRVRIHMYNCEGILPTSVDSSVWSGGIGNNGFVYLGPGGNKIARLGNSATFGATNNGNALGWIEVDLEGTTGYLKVYDQK